MLLAVVALSAVAAHASTTIELVEDGSSMVRICLRAPARVSGCAARPFVHRATHAVQEVCCRVVMQS